MRGVVKKPSKYKSIIGHNITKLEYYIIQKV